MKFYIVIPAHNEEKYIQDTLQSLVQQTLTPSKIVIVNDGSTDGTQKIIDTFQAEYPYISSIETQAEKEHAPGSKVINAFQLGYKTFDQEYDIICKFDADLIFPPDYLEQLSNTFQDKKDCGMAGGFCYIDRAGSWKLENLTNKDHLRGALKAYRKECYTAIGGLKNTMGWDTVDELLAQYHGWTVCTLDSLIVKHLKPTGDNYTKRAKLKQGEAFYKMRYGWALTQIASIKLALRKGSFTFYLDCIRGYKKAEKNKLAFIVSKDEGAFIRKLRKDGIRSKLTGGK